MDNIKKWAKDHFTAPEWPDKMSLPELRDFIRNNKNVRFKASLGGGFTSPVDSMHIGRLRAEHAADVLDVRIQGLKQGNGPTSRQQTDEILAQIDADMEKMIKKKEARAKQNAK